MRQSWQRAKRPQSLDPDVSTPVLIAVSTLAVLPLALSFSDLRRLYWFGDDWGLLWDAMSAGPARWTLQPFAENFAPVFKLVWLAEVSIFRGAYLGMVLSLWACHFLNVLLLGVLLRRAGFGLTVVASAAVLLGLSWTNLETLAWSPQLSQLLSLTFLLLAWKLLMDLLDNRAGHRAVRVTLYGVCTIVAGFCFSRGLLGGVVLAVWVVGAARAANWPRHFLAILAMTLVCSASTIAVALRFSTSTLGRFEHLDAAESASVVLYAAAYELLNPLLLGLRLPWQSLDATGLTALPFSDTRRLLGGPFPVIVLIAAIVAGIKVVVELVALMCTSGRGRAFLVAMLVFDLGNATLLGVGRYHLGLGTAVSSRYQYVSLLCFAPSAGILLRQVAEVAISHLHVRPRVVEAALALVVAALGVAVLAPWPTEIAQWAEWRGTAVRAELANGPADAKLSSATITITQARTLVQVYDLH